MLYLVGVQEVRWDRGGTTLAGEYRVFCGKGNENRELGIVGLFLWCMYENHISNYKRVDFVCDRMLYIILRGR